MPELGFQDLRSGLRARDISPDSVIFTAESNFSLFSSASASVERCSFASDVPDQESVSSVFSQVMLLHFCFGFLECTFCYMVILESRSIWWLFLSSDLLSVFSACILNLLLLVGQHKTV